MLAEKSWFRLPSENEEQWAAFEEYREQKPPRKIFAPRLARWSMQDLSEWYRTKSWRERTADYDVHLDAVRLEAREDLLRRSEQDRLADDLELLALGRELVTDQLSKLLADSREQVSSGLMPASALTKLLKEVISQSRLVRGESTQRIEIPSLDGLSVEELRQIKELYTKGERD